MLSGAGIPAHAGVVTRQLQPIPLTHTPGLLRPQPTALAHMDGHLLPPAPRFAPIAFPSNPRGSHETSVSLPALLT